MDISPSITCACMLIFLYLFYMLLGSNKRGHINIRRPPEVAGSWPLIGHLYHFGGSQLPHKIFSLMADTYGAIFTVKFGSRQIIVVNDWKIAQNCCTINDKAFSSRPKSIAVELLGYNYAVFGLGPYGEYWREIKKIVVLELLSNRRVKMYQHIREFEVKTSIQRTYEKWLREKNNSDLVELEMKQWFENLTMILTVRILFGKRYTEDRDIEEGKKASKAIRKYLKLLGVFIVGDFIPLLRWLDIGGYKKQMKETAKEMDGLLESWLVEHKKKRSNGEKKFENEDFMDIMLSLLDAATETDLHGYESYDVDTIIKSTCLSMLLGGTDTISATLTWTLCLLLNHPHVMEKAQEELDIQIGRNSLVEESHIKDLVYLQAIVKESYRLYPAGPLSSPRESIEDCIVDGYNIPKGTRLLFNLWKIQRDPNVWPQPELFKPERFLTTHKDVDVRGNHFELIPFGAGRRICPGISSAQVLVHLTLANFLHSFEIKRPLDEPIDMTESSGLTNHKASPLNVLVAPRLSPNLYQR